MNQRCVVVLILLAASAASVGAQQPDKNIGAVRISQRVSTANGALEPGTYQIRLSEAPAPGASAQTAAAPGQDAAVGTSGQSASAPSAPDGPWVELVQNGNVRLRTMAVVPPDTMNIPAGVHAMRVHNDDDPYVRISVKQGGRAYLVYLPAGS